MNISVHHPSGPRFFHVSCVGDDEARTTESKSGLLRTLVAAKEEKSAAIGVPSQPKWRAAPDPDEHYIYAILL